MFVEMRTYTLQVGRVPEYLRIYEAEGMETQKRILGLMLGYYSCDSGDLNQVIHMWGYDDMPDRAQRRTALFQDPVWLAYIPKVSGLILKQENRFLSPARFLNPKR